MTTLISEKVLWDVSMTTQASEIQLLTHAKAAGATGVAIRTSNARLKGAIGRFGAEGIKVYGWRWPARRAVTSPANYFAPDQANFVVDTLISAGLAGYFADIESDNDGGANDWNDGDNSVVAKQFCDILRNGAPQGFVIALTSGAPQPVNNKKIPWKVFVDASDFLLPQTYWRWTNSKGKVQDINGGTPAKSIAVGDTSWAGVGHGKTLVPMIGELDVVSPAEIAEFGAELVKRGESRLHVYTDTDKVTAGQLAAIKAL